MCNYLSEEYHIFSNYLSKEYSILLIICQKNIPPYPNIFLSKYLSEEYRILSKYLLEEYPILSNYLSEEYPILSKHLSEEYPIYLIICQKNILSYLIICQRDGIDHRHLSLGLSRASYSAPASAVAEVHKIDYNQDMYTITYSNKKMDEKACLSLPEISTMSVFLWQIIQTKRDT